MSKNSQGENNRLEEAENQPVIVGVGSSAGGLEALRLFVSALKPGSNMSYVIAQHMSPDHRSMMTELLSRETELKVLEVKHNLTPVVDSIYVAQPDTDVFIKDGKLKVRKPLADIGAKPSVDYLFTTMAEELGERAIAVVMSGTGGDGSHGIRSINAAGGISIAQSPKTAKYDSMPLAAIKAGVDLVLAPDEIAQQLVNINTRPRVQVLSQVNEEVSTTPIDRLVKLIFQHTKMDFSNYKLATLTRQVERRMAVLQIVELSEYVKVAEKSTQELDSLVKNFLICVTSFFRDTEAFDALNVQLQALVKTKSPGDSIRIWVPGCATGEEAYSIGIMVSEILGDNIDKYDVKIFATDANKEAAHFGRRGLYPGTAIEGVLPELLEKYFERKEKFFQVVRSLKDMVLFANHDLVQDPPFVRVDAISCRNLLIYFKPPLQEQVFRIFHYALNTGGILFIGKSESIGHNTNLFSEINRKLKLFRKNNVPARTVGVPHFKTSSIIALEKKTSAQEKEVTVSPVEIGRKTLFEAYAPPSVLITADGDITEFLGDVSPFTHLSSGKPDFSLFAIVHPTLRTELRAMVQKVIRSGETVHTRPVPLKIEGEERLYRCAIRPSGIKSEAQESSLLVSFERINPASHYQVDLKSIDEVAESRILELEHELTITRESLQTVIEELETSNEELQATNEEAQAANEELQASNEELETSNEELQATNEELTTVNDELSTKTNQLADALDDVENIQNSINRTIVVIDRDLNIRRYNQNAFHYFKLDPAISRPNLASIPLNFDIEGLHDKIRKVSSSGESHREEFSIGDRFHEIDIVPFKSSNHSIDGGVVLIIHDVTTRTEVAHELSISEGRFRSMVESAGDAIYIHDRYGKVIDVNPVALKQTGYNREEMVQLNIQELDATIDFQKLRDAWDLGATDPGHFPITLQSSHRRKDGSVFPMEVRVNILPTDGENLYVAVVRDITLRKQAEQLLEEKIRELDFQKKALDEHAIVSITDFKGNITYINEKFCDISGYSREELLGQNHRILKSGAHPPEFFVELWKTISSGHSWHGEIKNRKKDGAYYWVEATIVPFPGADGKPCQYIGIRTDITDKVKARMEADRANQSKSEFLSSMSHELRTPLNAIVGFSDLIESDDDELLSQTQKEYIGYIKSGGEHLMGLINDILDLARIESGAMNISPEPLCPGEVIQSIINIMNGSAATKNIELDIQDFCESGSPGRRGCAIMVDQIRFRQIMLNLIGNAIKYNRENGRVQVVCRTTEDRKMRVTVNDTGFGIPEKLQPEVFTPFNRLGHDEGSSIKGTGIGLAICKTLTELMGGQIGFSSVENEGSSFWVQFPLSSKKSCSGALKKRAMTKEENVETESREYGIKKALYIEDNDINTKLMERIFERFATISLTTASTAESGLEKARQEKPELILMDINLPGMSGTEAMQVIRESDDLKDIPVIAVSANALKHDIEHALSLGFHSYITKPFKWQDIEKGILSIRAEN